MLKPQNKTTWKEKKYSVSLLSILLTLFSSNFLPKPVLALGTPVGVVRSAENTKQWSTITERLQAVGVSYCILETRNWQQEEDLKNFKVLFLPNVENINGSQAIALQKWMSRGGQVIVTGPTGNLSQSEIKTQLKTLFGAYWGFANSSAATLKLNEQGKSNFSNQPSLSNTFIGGVIIPTGVNSQTLAIWMSKGKPPAVVGTNKATYLGWRWGIDGVSPLSLDSAWLKVALSRHGVKPDSNSMLQAVPCQVNSNIAQNRKPPVATTTRPQTQNKKPPVTTTRPQTPLSDVPLTSPVVSSEPIQEARVIEPVEREWLTAQQITEMSQELSSLIARYESTLLAANASNSNLDLSPQKIIETSKRTNTEVSTVRVAHRSSLIVQQAKENLENFQQLIQAKEYEQARELWLKARRSLWDNYPTERQFAQSEIRAMWLDRGTIVQAKSEEDLAKVFDRMANAGVNVVFFETINASYPIYPSAIAPEQNPLTQGWDPLKAAVKLAHERGMEIHAWAWIFAAANQRHNEVMGQPKNYLGPVLSRHPDWVITNKQGEPFDYGKEYKKAFYDPANPEVQEYLLSLLEEIATNYDVDGVQFDYIRYPFQAPQANETFGYGLSSRWLFKQETGVDPIDIYPKHPLWNSWTSFRAQQVTNFVAIASTRLKQIKPNLLISAAVFPMAQQERMYRLQQNWEEWGKRGWVDLICLMTYALDTGNLEERTQLLYEPMAAGASLIIPGIRLLKVPDSVTIDQMQLLRNMPTSGFALFAAENLTPNLQSILNRTQGVISSNNKEPLPYRQPFQTAALRFQGLQKEWSFLMVNNQLAMNEGTMKNWGQQVDYLAESFNKLAQNPTPANLAHTQNTLKKFRTSFSLWMSEHKQKNAYQVQVWQNRLDTIDRLLVYGDRLTFNNNTQNYRKFSPNVH
ncbi:hypothetical protein C7H19_23270 [Aphanothece hegewaldii CCALA 016]|uniref:Glycosyl hydrolase-like 10 domain-containing protein n=1 Tax=Aphanothece hegewaldii CCALA 016 TaxID=2107694 RepID=A0A2T1LRA2_9CHRO|nr:family 10 glycosylhydrolase [Aphanothece hegewaldii]PSF31119.1 hypothetical protein C7H19_23270 [Aphanothece hegewaldii CCALA 016]